MNITESALVLGVILILWILWIYYPQIRRK